MCASRPLTKGLDMLATTEEPMPDFEKPVVVLGVERERGELVMSASTHILALMFILSPTALASCRHALGLFSHGVATSA